MTNPPGAMPPLPEHLVLAVDHWFAQNTGLGGCSEKDVSELASLFYGVTFDGGRESVEDAMAVVESFGPGVQGLNDTFARQVILAAEVKRLEAYAAPLIARVAELQADAARIDWMEKAGTVHLQRMRRLDPSAPKYWDVEYGLDEACARGDSIRSAIDAAIAAKD